MKIYELMYQKKWSKYKLYKESGIPYSTLEDIFSKKTTISNLTLSNAIKLAKALNINVEDVINLQNRTDEDLFRSIICHNLKNTGDFSFIRKTIASKEIEELYKYNLYFESLYLLSMLDYVSRRNNIPLVKEYENIRKMKLSEISYPKSVLYSNTNNKDELINEFENSIEEFKIHNIAEREVDNAV